MPPYSDNWFSVTLNYEYTRLQPLLFSGYPLWTGVTYTVLTIRRLVTQTLQSIQARHTAAAKVLQATASQKQLGPVEGPV